mgnify:CR=1 FL=1
MPVQGTGVRLDSLAEFGVPPMVTGPCNPSVEVRLSPPFLSCADCGAQAKLANFHHLALTRGLHFNDSLSASKAFRNPRIYTKLVEFVKVDETGTNWDPRVWNPKALPADADASRIGTLLLSPSVDVLTRNSGTSAHEIGNQSLPSEWFTFGDRVRSVDDVEVGGSGEGEGVDGAQRGSGGEGEGEGGEEE